MWLQQIIQMPDTDPIKNVTYNPTTFKNWDVGVLRRGGPQKRWFATGKVSYWDAVKSQLSTPFKSQEWKDTPNRTSQIIEAAHWNLFNPRRLSFS